MAVVGPMPVIPQHINPIRHTDIGIHEMMARRGEIVEETPVQIVEDKICVAVGKDLNESKLTLSWALHNSRGRKICIIHVHEPAQRIPFMGTKFSESQLEEQEVRAYREIERQAMNKLLLEYRLICDRAGVRADVLHIEMDSIEKGIVELISRHDIKMLVMGAAAARHYSKKMMEPKSKKAIYVRLQAPVSCLIWFVCKGHLVHTREGILEGVSEEVASLTRQASPNTGISQSSSWKSLSATEFQNHELKLVSSSLDHCRVRSNDQGMNVSAFSPDRSRGVTPRSSSNTEGSFNIRNGISSGHPSLDSHFSSYSASDMADDSALTSPVRTEDRLGSPAMHCSKDDHRHASSCSVLEGDMNNKLYDQLVDQAMAEAENCRREALEESVRHGKAEKNAIDAFYRAKALESLYAEELRRRKETEGALVRVKEELEKMKQQVDEIIELHITLEQKSSLESQIANTDQVVQELEQKMFSAVELGKKYKKERDELRVERDNALKVAEELREKQAEEASNTLMPQFFPKFSFSEIKEATRNFDSSLKIGVGGYGSIYKCLLHHTQVAIKTLHSHSLQGASEFEQEVNVLTKLRHPNLVTLIGACPDAFILVYEYLDNGSLEDRLNCKDNTPPLSWQTRIRIAAELCSVLIFLHSQSPNSIVHADLKPANILLDVNYVSKLSDFGICRVISQNEFSSNNTTVCYRTDDPRGTLAYIDPEYLATGELTTKSDVYAFGIILLRLLTGKPAPGIAKEVQSALDKGNLKNLLDPKAGDWPFGQAKQLIHLAMRCCEMNRRSRPDLASEVWNMLEPMRVLCGASSFRRSSQEHCQIPPYFICPISKEVMQDPHVAADGFTYELEAFNQWLDRGHYTSVVTKLKLPHFNLVPNHALRSAIQEWLQPP